MCYILSMQLIVCSSYLEPWQFGLIMLIIVLTGLALFFLTGFTYVRKNRIAVIERLGMFTGLYKHGLYYFMPLVYRRVGYYRIDEISEIYKINKEKYRITYEIIDVKKFHYIGNHNVLVILEKNINNSDNLSASLKENYNQIGVKFIRLERIIKE